MGAVANICDYHDFLAAMPSWMAERHWKRVYWHKSIRILFRDVYDRHRFVDGMAFFCRRCDLPAAVRMDYDDSRNLWIVTRVICHLGCWAAWRLEGTRLILNDLEGSQSCMS